MLNYDANFWTCDHCDRNIGQLVFQTAMYEESSLLRGATYDGEHQVIWSRERNYYVQGDRFCFTCCIREHGAAYLGELGVYAWKDAPRPESIPDAGDIKKFAEWEAEQAERQRELEMRELEWHLRDQDIFASE
jgi:hypothetical protein